MALSSLGKLFQERLSYFSNWKFNFQKIRVITSLTYIDEALNNQIIRPIFVRPNRGTFFYNEVPSSEPTLYRETFFYEEALFLNHIIDTWKFDISKLSKYEQQDYLLAVEKLKKWNDMRVFMKGANKFIEEIKRVTVLRRQSEYPNKLFMYKFPFFEASIVSRYHEIVKQLEPYPEWRQKFINEVEPHIKILADHSPVDLKLLPREVYAGIELQKYFR